MFKQRCGRRLRDLRSSAASSCRIQTLFESSMPPHPDPRVNVASGSMCKPWQRSIPSICRASCWLTGKLIAGLHLFVGWLARTCWVARAHLLADSQVCVGSWVSSCWNEDARLRLLRTEMVSSLNSSNNATWPIFRQKPEHARCL